MWAIDLKISDFQHLSLEANDKFFNNVVGSGWICSKACEILLGFSSASELCNEHAFKVI